MFGVCIVSALACAAPRSVAQPLDLCGDGLRFVVAERPGHENQRDSYTLVLNEPADIAHARRLIAEGPGIGNAIVYARIEAGADLINRDWRAPGFPAWSWHVVEFFDFVDSTAEIFDYWPGGIEEDPEWWIKHSGTGGGIGFWLYTVVEELPPPCPADFNCDQSTGSADFFEYLASFFHADPRADYNNDGAIDSADFFDFLGFFFTGCG
jgi:hypothetical protein